MSVIIQVIASLHNLILSLDQSSNERSIMELHFRLRPPFSHITDFSGIFFSVDKFLGLGFTQLSCEWKFIGLRKFWSNLAKFSPVSHSQWQCSCVYANKGRQKDRTLCNFNICFTKGRAYFPWLTHNVLQS